MARHENFKDYLHRELLDPNYSRKYFEVALDDYLDTGEKGEFLAAIRDIVDAHGGPTNVCKITGINRQTLYKSLSKNGNPTIETLHSIMSCVNSTSITTPPTHF